MAISCQHSSLSSASLLSESTDASPVDYRCFRPCMKSHLETSTAAAESAHFNAALHFKRSVTCTTDIPTLPTATELECISKKFKWDAFQLIAAGCILKGESVLVCAHTSSGKTVVGEFAVARALAAGQRIL
jgi:superfamily II RNA helicase